MNIPDDLKFRYLLSLDEHIENTGVENKNASLKKIFAITKEIADLGFTENDIHAIAKDEDLYVKYEKWRISKNE